MKLSYALAVIGALLLSALAAGPLAAAPTSSMELRTGPQGSAFWDDVPTEVPAGAKRGDIYWVQQRFDAPKGAKAWNVVYVTEGADGKLTYVSGEIYLPAASRKQSGHLVLWNHETAGMQDSCAPSRRSLVDKWGIRIPALEQMLDKGFVVVASDYQGLGTPGSTAYLNGAAQAKASLDAVRLAQTFPGADAGPRFVEYGWSQGGQTSLWLAHLQQAYAPELELLGAGEIAPASRHWDLTEYDLTTTVTGGYYISRMVGLRVGHPELALRDVLSTDGLEMLEHLSAGCWAIAEKTEGKPTTLFANRDGLQPGKPWRQWLEANDAFLPVRNVPFVFFQGDKDIAVPVELNRKVARDLCQQGVTVDYRESKGLDHENIVPVAVAALPNWFADRFKGVPAQSACAGIP